jgi:excisionase family DNA binding protein
MNVSELKRESGSQSTPWLTVEQAAERARCGVKTIYREVRAGRLRAARVGGRRELRLLVEWVDDWLLRQSSAEPLVLTPALR